MTASINNKPRVFCVEDNIINMDLLLAFLEPFNIEVLTSYDGRDAVKKALENPDICVILLDISLPGIDGVEVFKRLKSDKKTMNIPVIAVTAHAMSGNRERLLSIGFNDFIEKPIDKSILYEKLNKYIGN